jgi:hypothetical protein
MTQWLARTSIQLHHGNDEQRRYRSDHGPPGDRWRGGGTQRGEGTAIYQVDTLVERPIVVNERLRIEPRIEVFNLFNHANFVGFSGTYGNGATAGAGFGQPLAGITNQLPARSIQFLIKVMF